MPARASVDLALSLMELRVEGDAKRGWRVQTRLPFEGIAANESWFVVSTGAGPRLLGTGYDSALLGQEALRRAEGGDLEGARQWLDWARDTLPATLTASRRSA